MVSTYFVDTSALAKRYFVEIGTQWVLTWIEPQSGQVVIVSELALVEMRSVLARRIREGLLTITNAAALRNDFLIHAQMEYLSVPVDTSVFKLAGQLVERYPLRTLDAIQLACALQAAAFLNETLIFVSADNNLLQAAAAEGFATDNPNHHP